ncbi:MULTISPECIES: ABC transporter ATP-binding protein [unclassified Curtobacterium]|uniref:ABC transporter ATP-binding protein n=1 Tax=unclassified Curtobacterium TaxID=257496 RepID=UPI002789BE37|nr:ABC transporter ATP-binding protein [Curtobacterium sp. 260]MDP9735741.1 ABC-2 type transport system ATP-binding protein [Curtobacterium sp. 260]
MAAADDDDVYATSDAAWLADADGPSGDAADDDTGDEDARDDASDDDEMTDDTTGAAVAVGHDEGAPDQGAAPETAVAASDRTPRKGKGKGKGKGRAARPSGPATPAQPADTAATGSGAAGDDASSTATTQRAGTPSTAAAGSTAKEKRAPGRQPTATAAATQTAQAQQPVVLRASGLVKRYGQTLAADEVDLEIRQGSIFGVVGPNGAGKTTTLSMVTGLLRPDAGTVTVLDHDVWSDPTAAKRALGVLPDRLRLFDRLTGAQLLHYSATLRGLDGATARKRSTDLAEAFGLGEALGRQVADYSVGMAKKIALAATLIHSPRVLVLDEPFESVDPVSAATITDILRRYTRGGGTVVLSSHSMELVQRTCDSVAIIVGGKVLASGTMAQVRGRRSLEDKFVELAGGRVVAESMEWLHSFSD